MENSLEIWQDSKSLTQIRSVYGKNLSDAEFTVLCGIGRATNLNPFLREIWAVKYGNQPANIFIGRDGYRKAAQANPEYDHHLVDAVYSNDEFKIENAEVKHTYSVQDRGRLVGAYCVVKRVKSTKPTFVFVDFKEYYQGNKDKNGNVRKKYDRRKNQYVDMGETLWDTKPATMIKKVAEAQGLRMAFQSMFAGTYDESEAFERQPQQPTDVTPQVKQVDNSEEATKKILNKIEGLATESDYTKLVSALSKVRGINNSDKEKINKALIDKQAEIKNKSFNAKKDDKPEEPKQDTKSDTTSEEK